MSTAAGTVPPAQRIDRPRLPPAQLFGTALQGLCTRRLRAALSALGIAIGIGAMVAVVGISSSAQANLIAEIDALGTNLLTVTPGQTFTGNTEVLPNTAVAMIDHTANVNSVAAVYQLAGSNVYRSPLVPAAQTGGIGVDAAGENLPDVVSATIASGRFLGAVSNRYPEAVLGAQAATVLQITRVSSHLMVDLGNTWFTVVGIMNSATLDTGLDSDVFVSLPVAARIFGLQPNPSTLYVRANQDDVTEVSNLLAATADPQNRSGVQVSRPSDALEARAAIKGQFTTLLLGLGAVALLVGALLAVLGGIAGLILGAGATWIYSQAKHEPSSSPGTHSSLRPPPASSSERSPDSIQR
jgi:putative ABC transport system permease protein